MNTPYYAVIFTSLQTPDTAGYSAMAEAMEKLAEKQPGYLGLEHARSELGITISYWENLEAISNWKANLDHLEAQKLGKTKWYQWYKIRICKVEREYEFEKF
ncbi:heme-degrading monooxygenase HmoA [Ulvibacter sp. MAR_2010_11]|uniref:antibiotic biosynthesis monooxygenase family protein n=1 Tax=Ulvibacter sp. MAR_2010_11 TaxID=1250229 RepID=UPI000C2C6BF3|nr:antibiotic biosynthesis monooxygenase [Ulvibacter sp. MAR_2010_11]PKA83025.1 heme-degrading monooxygenase HmoA [Ulvibacter sp. MAR_2010_11]